MRSILPARINCLTPRARLFATILLAVVACHPVALSAQTSNASLRGYVFGTNGIPVADARVAAVDPASGFRRATTSNPSGFYNLSALPPGTYTVRVMRLGYTPAEVSLSLQVGEVANHDFHLGEAARQLAEITVTASRNAATRTSEVGGVVTPQQIQDLPQANRNFLDLAALIPGVTVRAAGISAGGASASNTNVFVDGVSFKNDVLPGGAVGQDPSLARPVRGIGTVVGNPFPQNAVQEFRVITQNYKAEYQKASGAVVTAATKSGTNEVAGDFFYYGQNQNQFAHTALDKCAISGCASLGIRPDTSYRTPKYNKSQFGASLGGPIVRDRAHYFLSYEGNYQYIENRVNYFVPATAQPLPFTVTPGTYGAPLHQNLFFGKLDDEIADNQTLVFTANVRHDWDVRDFGGNTAYTSRNTVNNDVSTFLLKHTLTGSRFTNEAQVSFQRFQWQDVPADSVDPHLQFFGVYNIGIGGATSYQNFIQNRTELRNDLTYTAAAHVLKGGLLLDLNNYNIDKRLNENPIFFFDPNRPQGTSVPYEADMQIGNPNLSTNNHQLGAYVQDDWTPDPRFTLNAGLRWDYESDWLNNSYVTPQWVVDSVARFLSKYPFFNEADYVTNGHQRPNFYGAVQPRLGFSWDFTGQNRTVLFGGGGIFYDRSNYNILLDEKYKAQRPSYRFQFSPNGGNGTIAWNPSYLSRAALIQLINSGKAGLPEVFLVNNHTHPPHSDQASIGVRQALGAAYQFSLTATMQQNQNQFKWMWGHRDPAHPLNLQWGANGMNDIIISTDAGQSRYRALLFSLSKPMVSGSRWGGSLNYTLSKTETNNWSDVEDPFAFDYVYPSDFTFIPSAFDERHRVVLNVVGRLPWGVNLSTITTLGSGNPYTVETGCNGPWEASDTACTNHGYTIPQQYTVGWLTNPPGAGPRSTYPSGQWFGPFGKWVYRDVDLRLQKELPTARGQHIAIIFDAFNVFNFANFNYLGYEYQLRTAMPQEPTNPVSSILPARNFQLGARYTF